MSGASLIFISLSPYLPGQSCYHLTSLVICHLSIHCLVTNLAIALSLSCSSFPFCYLAPDFSQSLSPLNQDEDDEDDEGHSEDSLPASSTDESLTVSSSANRSLPAKETSTTSVTEVEVAGNCSTSAPTTQTAKLSVEMQFQAFKKQKLEKKEKLAQINMSLIEDSDSGKTRGKAGQGGKGGRGGSGKSGRPNLRPRK